MQLFVKDLSGKALTIELAAGACGADAVDAACAKARLPSSEIRAIFGGKQLEPSRPLAEYQIEAGATVHLLPRVVGGVIEPSLVVLAKQYNQNKQARRALPSSSALRCPLSSSLSPLLPCARYTHAHRGAGLPALLRAPAPARHQLPQEEVRPHEPAAREEEAEVDITGRARDAGGLRGGIAWGALMARSRRAWPSCGWACGICGDTQSTRRVRVGQVAHI